MLLVFNDKLMRLGVLTLYMYKLIVNMSLSSFRMCYIMQLHVVYVPLHLDPDRAW